MAAWSVEPLPGWSHTRENGRYYQSERPDSPGWTEEEKQQVAAVRERQMELVTFVLTHPFWATCADVVKARSALKHAHEPADDGEETKV